MRSQQELLTCRGKIESIAEAPESRTVKDAHVVATSASATSHRKFAAERPPPQEVIDWLRTNAIPLTTRAAGHGFDDMQPLRRVVGNARIVALGEATHGTRELFQLKHRILEFLVTEMGFTVFTIEASYPDALAVNDYVVNGRGDPRDALAGARFWAWDTEEVLVSQVDASLQ